MKSGLHTMKITMISFAPMIFDGRIQNEAISLRDVGHDVTILFVDDQEFIASIENPDRAWSEYLSNMEGVKSVRLWMRSRMWTVLPKPIRKFAQAIELFFKMSFCVLNNKADVFHIHDLQPAFFGLMAQLLHGAYLIYDAHELEIEQGKPGLCGWRRKALACWENIIVMRSFRSITVNRDIANRMQKMYGGEIEVVENHPRKVVEVQKHKQCRVIAEHRATCPDLVALMYVGYLSDSRGVWEMLEALKKLPQNFSFLYIRFWKG